MHRDDLVEAAAIGDLERVDVQIQRDFPDVNHIHRKVRCERGRLQGAPAYTTLLHWCRSTGPRCTKLQRTATLR